MFLRYNQRLHSCTNAHTTTQVSQLVNGYRLAQQLQHKSFDFVHKWVLSTRCVAKTNTVLGQRKPGCKALFIVLLPKNEANKDWSFPLW